LLAFRHYLLVAEAAQPLKIHLLPLSCLIEPIWHYYSFFLGKLNWLSLSIKLKV